MTNPIRTLSLFLFSLVLGTTVVLAQGGTDANARPAVSARITSVDAAAGTNTVSVTIKATCQTGWDNNFVEHRLIVKQDLNGAFVTAFTNFFGSDVNWPCDSQEHVLTFNLSADGTWQAGKATASFDPTVRNPDTGAQAIDTVSKGVRIR